MKLAAVMLGITTVMAAGLFHFHSMGAAEEESLATFLESGGYRLENAANYSTDEVNEKTVAGISVTELEARSGEKRVSASIYSDVEEDFASSYIRDRREELASIYTDTPAPYEGIPGREVDCPERFVPKFEGNSTEREQFNLYSDSERKIGACSNATAEHRTRISILYCPDTRNLISLKISQPVEEGDISFNIECRSDG